MKLNLFDLTPDQEATSQMLYGKTLKCLIAPHHNYNELEKLIPFDKNTFLFPEREMTADQCRNLIAILAQKPGEEFRIITTNLNIICDMADACVRVLTASGKIVESPCKTFAANIHSIRYEILENPLYKDKISEEIKTHSHSHINKIIDKINDSKSMTSAEYDAIKEQVDNIGEDVIRNVLTNKLYSIKIVG